MELAFDSSGNIYVADNYNHRIQKFNTKTTPTITWNNPADIIYGTALSSTQLNAVAKNPVSGATVDGTFTYNPAAETILAVGIHTLNVDFTPTYPATYNTTSKDVTINFLTPVAENRSNG